MAPYLLATLVSQSFPEACPVESSLKWMTPHPKWYLIGLPGLEEHVLLHGLGLRPVKKWVWTS